jgi:hypothetical protein
MRSPLPKKNSKKSLHLPIDFALTSFGTRSLVRPGCRSLQLYFASNCSDFEQKKPAQLFQSIYQLLSILYNRDCRRPFSIDPNFWIIQELSPKTFLSEFEQSVPTKRAQQLMEKMPHVIPVSN